MAVVYFNLFLTLALLIWLWKARLASVYKLLYLYLSVDFVFTVVGMVTHDPDRYFLVYGSGQVIKLIVAAFVLVEIYSRSLENTPALAQYVRNSVAYILGAAALLPVVILLWDRAPDKSPVLHHFFLFEQTMNGTMAIFLIFLSVFLAYFPVKLKRNVFYYSSGFIVWALTHAVAVFLASRYVRTDHQSEIVSLVQSCVQAACLLYWMAGFRSDGESRTAVVGHLWSRAEAERLSRQLESINNSLERLRKR